MSSDSNKNPRMKDISWLLLAPRIVIKNEGRASGRGVSLRNSLKWGAAIAQRLSYCVATLLRARMWRQHAFHRRPMGAGGFVIVVGDGTVRRPATRSTGSAK